MSTTIDSIDIQITTSADGAGKALDKLTEQLEKLEKVLKPVTTQIEKMTSGFSKLSSDSGKAAKSTEKLGDASQKVAKGLDTANVSLMAQIQNLESLVGAINTVMDVFGNFVSQAIEWDGIQFRFGRAFGEDAEEVYQYVLKINDVLGINTQEFMQYSSLYGSLLSGFGMAQKKVTSISVGLTELSYDIWAAYNDRFKTLEEASEAVRSAITGEIEPIRNAGIALTEASLQEYIDSTDLAGISIEKLSEAQKAEVRYAAMVNAAMNQGIVGTYAREMNTAEGAVRSLSQSFKTLTQAFGSLFIPLLQIAIPYITAFVELLTEAVYWVASLFGIKIQAIDWSSTSKGVGGVAAGAEDAADGLGRASKAAKKLKDYTMGFDELNVISPDTPSGSGGGGGAGAGGSGWGEGLDLDSLWDDSVFATASKKVDELKQKVLGFIEEWKTELTILGAAFAALSVSNLLGSLTSAFGVAEKFTGVIAGIKKAAGTAIVMTIQFSLMKKFLGDFIDGGGIKDYIMAMITGGIATGFLYKMWGPTGIVLGLGVTAVSSLSAIIENGGITNVESATVALTGLASAVVAVTSAVKLLKKTNIGAFFALLKEGQPLLGTLAAAFPKLANVITAFSTAVSGVLTAIAGALGLSVGWVVAIIAGIAAAIAAVIIYWDEIKLFFTTVLPELWSQFTTWLTGIASAVIGWFGSVASAIGGFFTNCWAIIVSIWAGAAQWFNNTVIVPIVNFFSPIVDWFAELFGSIWQTVSDVFYNIGVIATGCWAIIEEVWGIVAEWFSENIIGPVGEFFTGLWSSVEELAVSAWNGIKSVFSSISSWINSKIIQPVSNFFSTMWSGFKTGASKAWSGVKEIFGNVASFFRDTFEKAWAGIVSVFSIGGQIFVDIKNGVVEAFKKIVNGIIGGINKVVSVPFNAINDVLEFIRDIKIVGIKPFSRIKTINVPEIPLLAGGGVVDAGQMFIANEAGPELVGNVGNRTTVMNNDQIIEAVSRGVYSAVRAAMSESEGGGQNYNFYLDGKQIYASVKKTEAQRGVSLMGSQLGYAY